MKVVIFSTATAYSGGAIMAILDVLTILQNKGIVPFFILKGHGKLEDELTQRGISFQVIKSYDWCVPVIKKNGVKNRIAWIVKVFFNFMAEIETALVLKREKADIYHVNCIYNSTGILAARLLEVPVIWHLREFVDLPKETTVFINSKKAWRKINFADRIICVSNYLRKFYEDKIKDERKIRVVYDGIDFNKFANALKEEKEGGSKIFVALVGTAPIKGHEDAIRAIREIKDKGYTEVVLKIAGDWSKDNYNQAYLDELKRLSSELGVREQIEMVGRVEDMNTFWRNVDIAMVCSCRESFGLAAVEAMACGIPLICSNTSISNELTNDGKNVSVYETRNYEQLAKILMDCINNLKSESLIKRCQDAEAFVKNKFSISCSAEELFDVYMEVKKDKK